MAKAKPGPKGPSIELDKEEVKKLAAMGCTYKEMASFFNCSVDTLHNNYSDVVQLGQEHGKSSVRRMLWTHAQKGNSIALKYLIHNVLKERLEDVLIIEERPAMDGLMEQIRDIMQNRPEVIEASIVQRLEKK